jgi:hypothetical protein
MTDDQRRLLELLSARDDGATEALLLAHSFPLKAILTIIGTDLATAHPERTLRLAVWSRPCGLRITGGRSAGAGGGPTSRAVNL